MRTFIQKVFQPFKKILPEFIWRPIRAIGTAFITPLIFSHRTGHFFSSLKEESISSNREPIPWYTYPCIEFLQNKSFVNKSVLEFGSGQSTLYWAKRANNVIAFEANKEWYDRIKNNMPSNVDLYKVTNETKEKCLNQITSKLENYDLFDAIVIDGLFRESLIPISINRLKTGGIIIFDNAQNYDVLTNFKGHDFQRVDFIGHAPGVVLPHSTSIFFKDSSFIFDLQSSIPRIDKNI